MASLRSATSGCTAVEDIERGFFCRKKTKWRWVNITEMMDSTDYLTDQECNFINGRPLSRTGPIESKVKTHSRDQPSTRR